MKTFEQFDRETAKRKTGYYGEGVDMYTKRDGSGQRVFRVQWFERNGRFASHAEYLQAIKSLATSQPMPREWVECNETFPYTAEGLQAALEFSKAAEPKREAFRNREA